MLGIDTDVIRGEHSAFDDQFQSVVEKVSHLHERVSDLDDGPAEFTLVKNCASICKVMHLLRAVGPYISQDKLLCFDDSVGASLGRIIENESGRVQLGPIRARSIQLMAGSSTNFTTQELCT